MEMSEGCFKNRAWVRRDRGLSSQSVGFILGSEGKYVT